MDFPKVELHVHLAGASRYETLIELALKKGIDVKGATNAKELASILQTTKPATLSKVLEAFHIFIPCVIGDAEALERVAYELCEDQAKNGVIYFEARYSPYLKTFDEDVEHAKMWKKHGFLAEHQKITPAEVVEAVTRGLTRGEADFGVKARSILSCICGHPDWNHGTVQL
uniref:adenosine deaminase n=1 Tax=Plectus sambesii TaxID=2011161 RepID=A0A914XGR6_9BILA